MSLTTSYGQQSKIPVQWHATLAMNFSTKTSSWFASISLYSPAVSSQIVLLYQDFELNYGVENYHWLKISSDLDLDTILSIYIPKLCVNKHFVYQKFTENTAPESSSNLFIMPQQTQLFTYEKNHARSTVAFHCCSPVHRNCDIWQLYFLMRWQKLFKILAKYHQSILWTKWFGYLSWKVFNIHRLGKRKLPLWLPWFFKESFT